MNKTKIKRLECKAYDLYTQGRKVVDEINELINEDYNGIHAVMSSNGIFYVCDETDEEYYSLEELENTKRKIRHCER